MTECTKCYTHFLETALAAYRIIKKHGKTPGEALEVCHEAIKLRMKKFSKLKRWFLKRLMFSGFLKRRVGRRAEKHESLKFRNFEVRYIIGDGKEFDWGVDYVACGNYNFLKAQGADEFAPYVCMSDIALSDALDWGVTRTQTIANGCESCDFRFEKRSKTRISSKTPEEPKKSRTDLVHPSCFVIVIPAEISQRLQDSRLLIV